MYSNPLMEMVMLYRNSCKFRFSHIYLFLTVSFPFPENLELDSSMLRMSGFGGKDPNAKQIVGKNSLISRAEANRSAGNLKSEAEGRPLRYRQSQTRANRQ